MAVGELAAWCNNHQLPPRYKPHDPAVDPTCLAECTVLQAVVDIVSCLDEASRGEAACCGPSCLVVCLPLLKVCLVVGGHHVSLSVAHPWWSVHWAFMSLD